MPFRACKSHSFLKDSFFLFNVCRRFLTCLLGNTFPISLLNPFQVSCKYGQIIYDQTPSPRFDKVFKKWEEVKPANAENRQQLAYIILMELLAYQFASPIRWIETQDLLLTSFNFEHFVP